MAAKAKGTPPEDSTDPTFILELDRYKPQAKLAYCVACHNSAGVYVWANPFTYTPEMKPFYDVYWTPTSTTYINELISIHVFVINTGTNNMYSKTLPLVGTYFNEDAGEKVEPIIRCKYSINTPIATLVGTTYPVGMLSSITITMDTTVIIQPPKTSYLICERWFDTSWIKPINIPF